MDVPGTLVADRYELLEQVGAGGAGTVFRAHDRVLAREVAVKRLRAAADDDVRARLRVEARLAGALAHPGIARVYDYGEQIEAGAPSPYLVMEYVDGPSLRDLVRDGGPLPPERVMSIVAQVADALAVAHAAGVVHRDVKPGNILVRPDGTVVLADFGIARALDLEPMTLTGTIVGTVDYISPEQAAGQGASGRSDLYSLGMVAYECLTGVRPLRRDSQVATLLAHLQDDVPPLPATVPASVRDVVARLTARYPDRRPADAAATARLARAAMDAPTLEEAPAGALAALTRRGRRRWLAVAPVAAAAAVGIAYLSGAGGGPTPGPAAAIAAAASTGPSTSGPVAVHVTVRTTPTPAPLAAPVAAPVAAPARQTSAPARQPRAKSPARHTARHPAAAKKPHAGHGKAKGHAKHRPKGGKHGRK